MELLPDEEGGVVGKNIREYCGELPAMLSSLSGAQTTSVLRANRGPIVVDMLMNRIPPSESCPELFLVTLTPLRGTKPATTLHQQKLESLGILASSVAHDLNNILTSVLGHVSFLRLSARDALVDIDSMGAIESGARRAAAITQKILDFARGQETEFSPVNLPLLVDSALHLIRTSIPETIELEVLVDDRELFVSGDEHQLSQVLLNLILNARDALDRGGKIRVIVRSAVCDEPHVCKALGVEPGHYVLLQVSDNGHGIPADVRERIFEPFFTTKTRKGTGLGLAIVASIIKLHGGSITVDSTETKGTCFTVALPHTTVEERPHKGGEETPLPGGNEKILVVDDEESVRLIVQRSLEHLGYDVTVARSGAEALTSYAENPEKFQLVIIDMIMPHMPGDELFSQLKAIDNTVPVLVASGYSSDSRTRAILAHGGLGFIQKPFAVEELAREVRRCLDAARQRLSSI